MIRTKHLRTSGAVAAILLTLSLAACSGGSNDKVKDPTPQKTTASAMGPAAQTFGPACSAIPKSGAGSFNGMATAPVASAASANPLLSTLVAAVTKAGLVDTLNSADALTVFAPTNDAFAALPAGTVETLLKPENKDKLTKILTCHVIGAKAMGADVAAMAKADGGTHKVKTVGGCELSLKADGGKVTVTDENGNVANVTIADVEQSNGVIHVIDKVLLPKM